MTDEKEPLLLKQLGFRCVRSTNNETGVALPAPIISGKPVRFLWGLSRDFVGIKEPVRLRNGSQEGLPASKSKF